MAHLLLYDGDCGLCNRANRFVLARDRADRFRFAALQGPLAREILKGHGRAPGALDTVYLVRDYGQPTERLLSKGRAALGVLRALGGGWGAAARVLGVLPTALLNAAYDFVASHRYAWFGRADQCPLPRAEDRRKFLE